MTRLMQNCTDRSTKYHVSDENFGSVVTLKPRVVYNCHPDEPNLPRICVCPTVTDCFVAVGNWFGRHYIYETTDPAIEPHNVYDSFVTGEKWITKPAEFRLICTLNDDIIHVMYEALEMSAESLEHQERRKRKLQKVIKRNRIDQQFNKVKW